MGIQDSVLTEYNFLHVFSRFKLAPRSLLGFDLNSPGADIF